MGATRVNQATAWPVEGRRWGGVGVWGTVKRSGGNASVAEAKGINQKPGWVGVHVRPWGKRQHAVTAGGLTRRAWDNQR